MVPPGTPVFQLSKVFKSYKTRDGDSPILRGVTAEIGMGLTCILGPSGHGKSTLLNTLGGLTLPDEGTIWFYGRKMPSDERGLRLLRAMTMGWVFQANNLIGHLTAEGNVALPLLLRGVSRGRAIAAARRVLEQLRVDHLHSRLPRQLSGGEIQRVAIARALVAKPAVILADEPTGSLDPESAEGVMSAFVSAINHHGTPVVMVTHNEPLAFRYASRILRCENGILKPDNERKAHVRTSTALAVVHAASANGAVRA
jgi:putative ABC transport system ATP-binding protein